MFGPTELNRLLQYSSFNGRQIDEIAEHRFFFCIFYDLCLKIAALKNWQSFTCKYCLNFSLDLESFPYNISVH
ncbi:MAG: hypothetical protein N3A64_02140 [Desulfobacterota bacterium]|nr:hypothetical protein [Thermodesulfobacteriota bacterium]